MTETGSPGVVSQETIKVSLSGIGERLAALRFVVISRSGGSQFKIQNSEFRIQNLPRNQAAVSLSPSSIEKGGAHPNSRRISELSTVSDPVRRST